jgi:hypothetical protein
MGRDPDGDGDVTGGVWPSLAEGSDGAASEPDGAVLGGGTWVTHP